MQRGIFIEYHHVEVVTPGRFKTQFKSLPSTWLQKLNVAFHEQSSKFIEHVYINDITVRLCACVCHTFEYNLINIESSDILSVSIT